jgi:hypothetical protein
VSVPNKSFNAQHKLNVQSRSQTGAPAVRPPLQEQCQDARATPSPAEIFRRKVLDETGNPA